MLENTDSRDLTEGDLEDLNSIINQTGRDLESILIGYKNNKEMERPIIARLPNETYHLVSGNTRLCSSRVLGITPEVYVLDLPNI